MDHSISGTKSNEERPALKWKNKYLMMIVLCDD